MKNIVPLAVLLLAMLYSCQGGSNSNIDPAAIQGIWKWDVPALKEQVIKSSKIKKTKESMANLDSTMRPLEILRMEFKADGKVVAHVDSANTIDGLYEFVEDNKFLRTEIGNFPKVYKIQTLTKDKIVLLETLPKSPIRVYTLFPAKLQGQ
jgi:hypothetical protein